jgi:hypothetical protein
MVIVFEHAWVGELLKTLSPDTPIRKLGKAAAYSLTREAY